MKKVLLLRPDKAGDAIKTLPALRTLVEQKPDFDIQLLGSSQSASLFAYEPDCTLHTLPNGWQHLERNGLYQSLETDFCPPYEKVVNLQCDAFEETQALLCLIEAKQKYSVALIDSTLFSKPSFKKLTLPNNTPQQRSEILNIALLLGQALDTDLTHNLDSHSAVPIVSQEDKAEAEQTMGPKTGRWLGICPFAGLENRSHPVKRWTRFIRQIVAQGSFDRYFVFGAPSDVTQLEMMKAASPKPQQIQTVFASSFRTLTSYFKRLNGVVAIDSGPLHLALAMQIPSLGILSGGVICRWFPTMGKRDRLLPRGLFSRFPTSFEMIKAYRKWLA